jgi:hypothetical protein
LLALSQFAQIALDASRYVAAHKAMLAYDLFLGLIVARIKDKEGYLEGETAMATWQAFILGLMVALTPSLVVVAALLIRECNWGSVDQTTGHTGIPWITKG